MTTDLADGEYMIAKKEARKRGFPHSITIRSIERKLKLRAGQLANYRANSYSRR